MSRPTTARIVFALSLLALLAVLVPVVVRVARMSTWLTGARFLPVTTEDGRELDRGPYGPVCGDVTVSGIVDREWIWTPCRSLPGQPDGGLMRIEPGRRRGIALWPWPGDLLPGWLTAAARASDGTLAVAYVTRDARSTRIAVGIAGQAGWLVPPRVLLAGSQTHRLLGLAWVGDAVEAALGHRISAGDKTSEVLVARIDRRGGETTRAIVLQLEGECIRYPDFCRPVAAWLRTDGWRVLYERGTYGSWASATGMGPLQKVDLTRTELSDDVTIAGRFRTFTGETSNPIHLVGDDGQLVPLGPPPGFAGAVPTGEWYVFDGDRLRWRTGWLGKDEPSWLGQMVGGRALEIALDRTDPVDREDALLLRDAGPPPRAPVAVARAPSYGCGDSLWRGILIPRRGGGFQLIDPSGCYIEVGADLRRSDPIDWREHIDRRGSRFMDRVDNKVLAFVFVFAGLPAMLLFGAFVGSAFRRSGESLLPYLSGAILLHAAIAGWIVVELWQALR